MSAHQLTTLWEAVEICARTEWKCAHTHHAVAKWPLEPLPHRLSWHLAFLWRLTPWEVTGQRGVGGGVLLGGFWQEKSHHKRSWSCWEPTGLLTGTFSSQKFLQSPNSTRPGRCKHLPTNMCCKNQAEVCQQASEPISYPCNPISHPWNSLTVIVFNTGFIQCSKNVYNRMCDINLETLLQLLVTSRWLCVCVCLCVCIYMCTYISLSLSSSFTHLSISRCLPHMNLLKVSSC